MLNTNKGYVGGSEIKAERCRPDYESMIKRANERLRKTARFFDAAMDYSEGITAEGKMAELIGEIVTQKARLEKEVSALVDAQEKDTA